MHRITELSLDRESLPLAAPACGARLYRNELPARTTTGTLARAARPVPHVARSITQ
jgi:hypothetical protein